MLIQLTLEQCGGGGLGAKDPPSPFRAARNLSTTISASETKELISDSLKGARC